MTIEHPPESCEPDAASAPLRELNDTVAAFRAAWDAWEPDESTIEAHLDAAAVADEVEERLWTACEALAEALLAIDPKAGE